MNFAAFSPASAVGLIVAVAISIWLLYLIRPRKRSLTISSTLLWRRVTAAHIRKRSWRWRWLLSFLLALAIGLSLVLALTHPQLRALEPEPRRMVVILDNSASMAARTRDGRTRWQRALDASRELIGQSGRASEVLLLDTAGRAPLGGFLPQSEVVERLDHLALSPETRARIPPLPSGTATSDAYLFTDGVAVSSVPEGMVVRSVFDPADNVGITAFTAHPQPSDPTRYSAFLQVTNAAPVEKRVALEVVGVNGFRVERQLQVAGASTANLVLDVSDFEQGPLRAHIVAPGDALDLDDTAYCVVSAHRVRQVLLVTRGNAVLEDSLRALSGIALQVSTPARLSALPPADAYVFDGDAPRDPPAAGALLFGPAAAAWLGIRWNALEHPVITGWSDVDPLAAGVDWRSVRLQRAFVSLDPAESSVVTARAMRGAGEGGALIMSGRARAKWVAVGFATQNSGFPLQPGFPIFLGTALNWLTESPGVATEGLGYIEVPFPAARVTVDGRRPVQTTATARGTLFDASRPGVYVAENGRERLVVVANVTDPQLPQINRQRVHDHGSFRETSAFAPWRTFEPWVWLLILAFGLLAIEWATFSRRMTE